MNKQQVELALGAGLELLGDKSETTIPVKLNDGIFFLKQLLHLIASGQLGLLPTMQDQESSPDDLTPDAIPPIEEPNPGLPENPKQPETPDRLARRRSRKKRLAKKK